MNGRVYVGSSGQVRVVGLQKQWPGGGVVALDLRGTTAEGGNCQMGTVASAPRGGGSPSGGGGGGTGGGGGGGKKQTSGREGRSGRQSGDANERGSSRRGTGTPVVGGAFGGTRHGGILEVAGPDMGARGADRTRSNGTW